MARILIGTFPGVGHINPFFPLVRALVARGHEVVWNSSASFQDRIEATGARYAPYVRARDFAEVDPEEFAPGQKLGGIASLKLALKHVFIDNAPRVMQDFEAISRDFRPDLILCDPACIGAGWYAQASGTPLALLNVHPLGLSSRDTAPANMGIAPDASWIGHVRNRTLNWAIEHVLFRDVQQHWNKVRAGIGLPRTGWFYDTAVNSQLYLQLTVPGFEYPRSDLIPHAHFIGIMPLSAPAGWQAPDWWGDLNGARPVVHVTQGTVANGTPDLIAPALAGLAGEDVLVVVSTGGRPVESLNLGQLPANARVATFLSYPDLLPRAAAMVTNGGYGGTQAALAYGIPLVVAGTTEDKLEVTARVGWSGAGVNLKTDTPSPEQVRAGVRAVLADVRYRERARALQAEYARYDAVGRGVALIERLAATGRAVNRDEAAVASQLSLRRVPAAK